MWCAERAPCSVQRGFQVASPAAVGLKYVKHTASQGSRPMCRPAEGHLGAKRFGQLADRSVFNTPTGYHPNSFTLSVCLMWASRKPEWGGEGREPPRGLIVNVVPGPRGARMSPDPGASTPGTSSNPCSLSKAQYGA